MEGKKEKYKGRPSDVSNSPYYFSFGVSYLAN